VSGIIIPDIPFEESGEVKEVAARYNVTVIDMVAPTSENRINNVCHSSHGFVYLVSSLGVTGVRSKFSEGLSDIIKKVKSVTATPVCVGFGISSPQQAADVCKVADGAIIGSAIVKIIAANGSNADKPLSEFIKSVADSVHSV
jgi:tryptophan synthase alpha chain